MSTSLLTTYKTKFTKALDFIVEDLRLSEEDVQELLMWMATTTRSRVFRPSTLVEASSTKEIDHNSFEAVFIPELDELNTKPRIKEKKNEASKPAPTNTKPTPSQGVTPAKSAAVPRKAVGGPVSKGGAKPPVSKLAGINTASGTKHKAEVANKATKTTSKVTPTAAITTKTNSVKPVLARQSIKPIQAITKSSKSKN